MRRRYSRCLTSWSPARLCDGGHNRLIITMCSFRWPLRQGIFSTIRRWSGTGTGDWKTDGQHYRRCQGVHLPVPAAVRGTTGGECGLIPKHVHSQLARCNPLRLYAGEPKKNKFVRFFSGPPCIMYMRVCVCVCVNCPVCDDAAPPAYHAHGRTILLQL